jgi:serine/threonine-protein kinase HipA
MTRSLDVWWDGRRVGRLTQDRHGDLGFAYAAEWLDSDDAPALSASLPKRAKPFTRRECRPFFGGLLPEEGQRDAAAAALGVSRGNDFALLDRLGGDVAGALQLLPLGEAPRDAAGPFRPRILDDDQLIGVLDALPGRPLLAGRDGMRLSLAGAQSKLPVVLADYRIALPAPDQPTTHIIKPPIARFSGTTANEAFVMTLAGLVDLVVARTHAQSVGDRSFLLVERYDRITEGKHVRRVHQEDFCQALGVPSERKYAAEGGPGFKECFGLVRRVSARPALDVLNLLDAAIFNLIVGNADAHGKNFSILYGAQGPRLAPLYDLLSTVAYPELSPKLAMKIGGRATLEEMDARAWEAFAAMRRVGDLVDRMASWIDTASGLARTATNDQVAVAKFADVVKKRGALAASSVTTGAGSGMSGQRARITRAKNAKSAPEGAS